MKLNLAKFISDLTDFIDYKETKVSRVQHKNTKVIILRGKLSLILLISTEQKCFVTIIACINAAEHYILIILFLWKSMQAELIEQNANICHKNDIFIIFFINFPIILG